MEVPFVSFWWCKFWRNGAEKKSRYKPTGRGGMTGTHGKLTFTDRVSADFVQRSYDDKRWFPKSILAEILDLSFVAETSLDPEAAQRCASGEWLCRGGARGSAHAR